MLRVKLGCSSRAHWKTATMCSTLRSFTSARRADLVIHLGAALALGFALVGSEAQAGVPLPVVAEVANVSSLAAVVKEIAPSIVVVEANRAERTARNPGGLGHAGEQARRAGSGVVFDAGRGLIITNSHVIDQADRISVRLTDGRALQAARIGADRNTDIAVIKVEAAGLTELAFADSNGLAVGDFVMAIGHPHKFGQTVSAGIVSGLHRTNVGLSPYEDFIQTDAAIYPGNSGGALVNVEGRLVGITTGFVGVSNGNPGFGFAIPGHLARSLAKRIVAQGDIRRGTIGLVYEDSATAIVADLKMSAPPPGAIILEVDTSSPAARAGFKPGDLVTKLGGTPVSNAVDLQQRISLLEIGDVAEFDVSRRGSPLRLRAAIAPPGPARTK
jgi:S1-C subfamily serine protease